MRVPLEEIAGATANSAGLVLPVTVKCTVCVDSSAVGPGAIAVAHGVTVCAPVFSSTFWSAPLVNDGGSLTQVTVIDTVAVEPPGVSV